MKKTPNLNLPIYDTPNVDKFKVSDWNEANNSVDKAYKEQNDNYKKAIESSAGMANLEVIDARLGESNLGAFNRKVTSQLEDIVVLRKRLNDEIDDTIRLQEGINNIIETGGTLKINDKELIISDTVKATLRANSNKKFKLTTEDGSFTVIKSKVVNKPTLIIENINDGNYNDGCIIENIYIKPFDNSYKHSYDGLELRNTIGVKLNNFYCYDGRYGLILQNDNGYTEQNVISNSVISNCQYGLTFKVSEQNPKWNGSFHGNIFNNVTISIFKQPNMTETIAINHQGGQLYNCRFDIKVMTGGVSPYLLYINGDSENNFGNISYEMFDLNRVKIKTGDNARAKFFLYGNIFGKGGEVDFSEYKPISIGELDYSNNKTPILEDNTSIGKEKFYCYNVAIPNKDLNISTGKTVIYRPLINSIYDLWNGVTNHFARYQNLDGKVENGYVMACKEEDGGNSRFIIGTINNIKGNIKDIIKGFEIRANGDYIKSKNGTTLNFKERNLDKNGFVIYDTQNINFGKAVDGVIHYPNGYIEKWGNIIVGSGQNLTPVSLGETFDNTYGCQMTPVNNTGTATTKNISMCGGLNRTTLNILTNFESGGSVYWRVYGYKAPVQ